MPPDFRYAQFCPLARAAEILGERWTLLVLRDLFAGPMRFGDLQRSLPGVSASILSERLARLEERGLIERRSLPPPASCSVYALSEAGRGLDRVLIEMARWGARFLEEPLPGDALGPRMLRAGLAFALRRVPLPERRFLLHAVDESAEEFFLVVAGPDGAELRDAAPGDPADLRVRGHPFALGLLAAGALEPGASPGDRGLEVEGDAGVLAELPLCFELGAREGTGQNPSDRSP